MASGREGAGPASQSEDLEYDAKVVFWTSGVVNARLATVFAACHRAEAAIVLSGLVGEDPGGDPDISDAASCRLMLAALKLSQGELSRLALWVEAAHSDPRDLIAAAEYPRQLGDRTDEAQAADLAEYLAWVRGDEAV